MFIPTIINDNDLSHLYLDDSKIEGAGKGVYSKIDILKGTIIEIACVLPIETCIVNDTQLIDYLFRNPYKKGESLIAFGYGSMYNHSDDPHVEFEYDKLINKMIYRAIKDIKAHEEIYVSYGEGWWKDRTIDKK